MLILAKWSSGTSNRVVMRFSAMLYRACSVYHVFAISDHVRFWPESLLNSAHLLFNGQFMLCYEFLKEFWPLCLLDCLVVDPQQASMYASLTCTKIIFSASKSDLFEKVVPLFFKPIDRLNIVYSILQSLFLYQLCCWSWLSQLKAIQLETVLRCSFTQWSINLLISRADWHGPLSQPIGSRDWILSV